MNCVLFPVKLVTGILSAGTNKRGSSLLNMLARNQIAFLCIQRLNYEENRPTRSSLKNQQQTAANPWTMAKAIGAPGVGTVDFDKGGKPEHPEKPSGCYCETQLTSYNFN